MKANLIIFLIQNLKAPSIIPKFIICMPNNEKISIFEPKYFLAKIKNLYSIINCVIIPIVNNKLISL